MAGPEASHEFGLIWSALQRDCRKSERGGPTLGPTHQLLDLARSELHAARAQKFVSLGRGEPKILGAHLEELTAGAQAGERQRRICSRRDGQSGSWRQALDNRPDESVNSSVVDQVVVIEHNHCAARRRLLDALSDPIKDARQCQVGIECRGGLERGCLCLRRPEPCRGSEIAGKSNDVVVACIERYPRASSSRRADPLGEQGALAEAGRRRNEDESRLRCALE